jgi:hypothetical protein
VFVNAGRELGQLESLSGILNVRLLLAFAALGLLPLVARKVLNGWRAHRVYKGWTKPRTFDRNLVVIGAGAAGLVTSYIAATVRAKVTLIEKAEMGGDCLNRGCVPSKALIRAARAANEARDGERFGVTSAKVEVDFGKVMAHVRESILRRAPPRSRRMNPLAKTGGTTRNRLLPSLRGAQRRSNPVSRRWIASLRSQRRREARQLQAVGPYPFSSSASASCKNAVLRFESVRNSP